MSPEVQIREDVANKLNDFFKLSKETKHKYSVKEEMVFEVYGTKAKAFTTTFDIIVNRGNEILALIDVKRKLDLNKKLQNLSTQAFSYLDRSNARYYIYTDGSQFVLFDKFDSNKSHQFFDFNKLCRKLTTKVTQRYIESGISYAVSCFLEALQDVRNDYDPDLPHFTSKELNQNIQYNDAGYFEFKGDNNDLESFENKLFQKMLPPFNDSWVYRYTTMNTIFSCLQHNTYRMFGVVGMNDRTEADYVSNYIDGDRIVQRYENAPYQTVQSINKRYISSCTSKDNEDDLTMWRLYADDSKGVSLKFKVNMENENSRMLLRPVRYAENNVNPPLEFIKKFMEYFRDDFSGVFKFNTLRTWKHFFKPEEYAIEKEVRLLIIEGPDPIYIKKDWVITNGINIFNPCIDFKLNDQRFLIELREIMLGPNLPDKGINKKQLEELIRQKRREKVKDNDGNDTEEDKYSINNLKVSISDIESYRIS